MNSWRKPGYSLNPTEALKNSRNCIASPTQTDAYYDQFIASLPLRHVKSLSKIVPKLFAEIEAQRALELDSPKLTDLQKKGLKEHLFLKEVTYRFPELRVGNIHDLSVQEFKDIVLGKSEIKVSQIKPSSAIGVAGTIAGVDIVNDEKLDNTNPISTEPEKANNSITGTELAEALAAYQEINKALRFEPSPTLLALFKSLDDSSNTKNTPVVNLQMIDSKGNESFLKHAEENGLVSTFGDVDGTSNSILLCNNVKSAKALSEVLLVKGDNRPVVACADFKSTQEIAEKLIHTYPNASVLLVADNNHGNLLNTDTNKAVNYGLKSAIDLLDKMPEVAGKRLFVMTPTFNYKDEAHAKARNYGDYDKISNGKAHQHIMKQHEHAMDRAVHGVNESAYWSKFLREQQCSYKKMHRAPIKLFNNKHHANADYEAIQTCHASSIQDIYTNQMEYLKKRQAERQAQENAEPANFQQEAPHFDMPPLDHYQNEPAFSQATMPEDHPFARFEETTPPVPPLDQVHQQDMHLTDTAPVPVIQPTASTQAPDPVVEPQAFINPSNTDSRFVVYGALDNSTTQIIFSATKKHAQQVANLLMDDMAGKAVLGCTSSKEAKALMNELLGQHKQANLLLAVENNHGNLVLTGKNEKGFWRNQNTGLSIGLNAISSIETDNRGRVQLLVPQFDYTSKVDRFGRTFGDQAKTTGQGSIGLKDQITLALSRFNEGVNEQGYWSKFLREQQAFYNENNGSKVKLFEPKMDMVDVDGLKTCHPDSVQQVYSNKYALHANPAPKPEQFTHGFVDDSNEGLESQLESAMRLETKVDYRDMPTIPSEIMSNVIHGMQQHDDPTLFENPRYLAGQMPHFPSISGAEQKLGVMDDHQISHLHSELVVEQRIGAATNALLTGDHAKYKSLVEDMPRMVDTNYEREAIHASLNEMNSAVDDGHLFAHHVDDAFMRASNIQEPPEYHLNDDPAIWGHPDTW